MAGQGAEWVFDGGRPCIDLVNTLRDRHRGGRELLTGPGRLAEWLSVAGLTSSPVHPASADVAQAVELREAVDAVVRAASAGHRPRVADVRTVNAVARQADRQAPRLRIADDGTPVRHVPRPADPVVAALGVVAVDAIELAVERAPVRVCAADDCGVRFVDSSPKRNRQWCSMTRCGNRAKARAHYARRRGTR